MAGIADPLQRIQTLYHFTDERNLPAIREFGGILSTALLRSSEIEFFAGGDEASLALDRGCGMDEYVHLCFDVRHPMAHHVERRDPGVKLKYLQIDRSVVYEDGVLFTTGVGYANGVSAAPIAEACERGLIDFHALYDWTDWRDPEAQQRRRAAELCEILVPSMVLMTFIKNMPNG